MKRILIAEDEPRIASFVSKGLVAAGFEAIVVGNGEDALTAIQNTHVDALLLDVGLPLMDGFEVVEVLRKRGHHLPVIILTARSSTSDAVHGLDSGANDYIRKPFAFDELLARIRSRLREKPENAPEQLTHGEVSLNLHTRTAFVAGKTIELSSREFALVEQFLRNPGAILSREHLLQEVWDLEFDPGSNVVDVYVRYLRNKLGAEHITTVRGRGYMWE